MRKLNREIKLKLRSLFDMQADLHEKLRSGGQFSEKDINKICAIDVEIMSMIKKIVHDKPKYLLTAEYLNTGSKKYKKQKRKRYIYK